MKLSIILYLLLIASQVIAQQIPATDSAKRKTPGEAYIQFDDTRKTSWPVDFKVVEINSTSDTAVQKAYFYKSTRPTPGPLIVSLHTWSGNYMQKDEVAPLCRQKDVTYIHPDFRGANKTTSACCSELALADIDDAITYAIKNSTVDTSKIYVIGVSGGGYATLSTFMNSKHHIRKFSAWASITDLTAWHWESTLLKNNYAADVLACTGSEATLNTENAKKKSPLFMVTPVSKRKDAKLYIYCGIYDGIQGSVPITHSINFYNKLLADMLVKDKTKYVSDREKLDLLEFRRPLGNFGMIDNRKICLQKQYNNLKLVVFEGKHEMLPEYALTELLKD